MSTAAAITVHDTPHAPPRMAIFGMTIFLASEAMLFAGLIGGYVVLRLSSPAWPPSPEYPKLPILLTGINTVFLITSSFTYHFAEVAVKKQKLQVLTYLIVGSEQFLFFRFLLIQLFAVAVSMLAESD